MNCGLFKNEVFKNEVFKCDIRSFLTKICYCTCIFSQEHEDHRAHEDHRVKRIDICVSDKNVVHSPILNNGDKCLVCKKKKDDLVIVPCGHGQHCTACLEEWYETNDVCPLCKKSTSDVVQCL